VQDHLLDRRGIHLLVAGERDTSAACSTLMALE